MIGAQPNGRAWIELDRAALRDNVKELSALLPSGCALLPVLKANAYGHGARLIARELGSLGLHSFCVASAAEGVELRKSGVSGDILVLGWTAPQDFPLLAEYDLIQTVLDAPYAALLEACGKRLRVHVAIDTGMHRLGERDTARLLEVFDRCRSLSVEGVYTHLCAAGSRVPHDSAMTYAQGRLFRETVEVLERHGCSCGKKHLLASGGLMNYPELGGSYARVGIALYGVLSERPVLRDIPPLRPVLTLKARIAAVRTLPAGEGAGYGPAGAEKTDRTIAIVSVGYADGFPRALSNGRGGMLVNGSYAPVLGWVCMDQTILDVSGIPGVRQGDIAVIIGSSGESSISAYDLAVQSGTITNEILSRLGARLGRIIV